MRWRLPRTGLLGGVTEGNWLWEPDSPVVRNAFQAAVDAGNRAHGPGTHWIEESHEGRAAR